jgi:hypothetical protein
MTQYAYFDSTAAQPAQVLGWFDDVIDPNAHLPDPVNLLQLTPQQWSGRLTGTWAVSGQGLILYSPPLPPDLQAQTALNNAYASGIAITSASLPTLNATYALDPTSTAQIFQIGSYAAQFGTFPSGGSTQPYPDIDGNAHVFNVVVFIDFLKAVAALVSNLAIQASILAQGGTPTWPNQSAALV